MKRYLWLALLSSLFTSFAAHGQQTYFPANAFDRTLRHDAYFSHVLRVLQEPSLFELARNEKAESYRFLWLRTFHHPVVVRLDVQSDGGAIVTLKLGSGSAGFPYTIRDSITNTSRTLTSEQVKGFLAQVAMLKFWSVPTQIEHDQTGTDGSEWVIEAVKGETYHVAARWSPTLSSKVDKRAVRELGLALVSLAGLNPAKDEVY